MSETTGPSSAARTWLWAAFIVLAVGAGAYTVAPKPGATERLAAVPMSGFGYAGIDLPFSTAEGTFLGDAHALKRRYVQGGTSLVVIAIDGANNRHVVHDPSFCFRDAGYELNKRRDFPLLNGNGTVLTLLKDDHAFEVAYWFSDGERRFTSYAEYLTRSALSRLSFGSWWAQPVMVTAHLEQSHGFGWEQAIDKFPVLMAF